MIKVEKLSYGVPEKELYQKISFEIGEKEHIAVIGSNGSGKTTLMDMLINTDEYLYTGKIIKREHLKIGYVSQYVDHDKDVSETVYEYLARDFEEMLKAQEEICAEMAEAEDFEEVMERYQKSLDAFAAVDGDNYDANIHRQLKLSGLTKITDVPVAVISGGEYKLVQIIREMMRMPDVLVMDEPDVFLDFNNLAGLKHLIKNYPGTILVVTHNRYILNHCFNKILQLENADLQVYEGSYMDYQVAILKKKVELMEAAAKDAAEIDRMKKVIQRAIAEATYNDNPAKGRQVGARKSLLEHLEARAIKEPFVEIREPEITLYQKKEKEDTEEVVQSTDDKPVLVVRDYQIAFEETLLSDVNFELMPGEKIALVGENGTGKTTLLRDICAREKEKCRIGYLSQIYSDFFDRDETVMGALMRRGLESRSEMKALLERYCFPEGMLDQHVSLLSGGEKNLLQIAMLYLEDHDILLLDEPTSHLDTYAQEALIDAIRAYPGAVLMVSHDFYMITGCVDQVLLVEDKTIRKMSGRAFRKKIYKEHFSSEYIELDKQKKETEQKIEGLLRDKDYEKAGALCEKLEQIVRRLNDCI